jgi:hypothetical protein
MPFACSLLPFYVLAQPAIPKFEQFQSIGIPRGSQQIGKLQFPGQTGSVLQPGSYKELNAKASQQANAMSPSSQNSRQQQLREAMQDFRQVDAAIGTRINRFAKSFEYSFRQLLTMNPDSFSITKAVYLVESAYYDNRPPSYQQFESGIMENVDRVKQILKKEGLRPDNNLAILYAIQKLYTRKNTLYIPSAGDSLTVNPFRYDFNDFMGDRDWKKMFVSKLLQSGTGQCHSLPLLFLCIAEQFQARAWLSLSPNHSFIQYFDQEGRRYNFETTNGNLVTQTWLMQSTYVNASALKNKTYLDTLSSRKLYAYCLGDLLLGSLMKTGHYSDMSNRIMKKVLEIDSTNIIGLMEQANYYNALYQQKLRETGNPAEDQYLKFPQLDKAYKDFVSSQHNVEQTGFQEMPRDAYQNWLQSLEVEKQKRKNQREQERMEQEIKKLKKLKYTFENKPKN